MTRRLLQYALEATRFPKRTLKNSQCNKKRWKMAKWLSLEIPVVFKHYLRHSSSLQWVWALKCRFGLKCRIGRKRIKKNEIKISRTCSSSFALNNAKLYWSFSEREMIRAHAYRVVLCERGVLDTFWKLPKQKSCILKVCVWAVCVLLKSFWSLLILSTVCILGAL